VIIFGEFDYIRAQNCESIVAQQQCLRDFEIIQNWSKMTNKFEIEANLMFIIIYEIK